MSHDEALPPYLASGVSPKKITVVLDAGEGNEKFYQGLYGEQSGASLRCKEQQGRQYAGRCHKGGGILVLQHIIVHSVGCTTGVVALFVHCISNSILTARDSRCAGTRFQVCWTANRLAGKCPAPQPAIAQPLPVSAPACVLADVERVSGHMHTGLLSPCPSLAVCRTAALKVSKDC